MGTPGPLGKDVLAYLLHQFPPQYRQDTPDGAAKYPLRPCCMDITNKIQILKEFFFLTSLSVIVIVLSLLEVCILNYTNYW